MDDIRFDHLARRLAAPANRRGGLRLLAGGLLGGLLPRLGVGSARAQTDSDQDGLFDDDETNYYRTKPDVWDTDGDGTSDGEEIWNRDQGLPGPKDPLTNENAAPPPPPPVVPTCTGVGGACSSNTCCQTDPNYTNVQCCFDANGAGVCTDVAARGTFLCPDPGEPATGCAVGLTNCGGFCTDLGIDHGNCGVCGNRCSQLGPDYNCTNGACVKACQSGMTSCGDICVDLQTHWNNCGVCGYVCVLEDGTLGNCVQGECWFDF